MLRTTSLSKTTNVSVSPVALDRVVALLSQQLCLDLLFRIFPPIALRSELSGQVTCCRGAFADRRAVAARKQQGFCECGLGSGIPGEFVVLAQDQFPRGGVFRCVMGGGRRGGLPSLLLLGLGEGFVCVRSRPTSLRSRMSSRVLVLALASSAFKFVNRWVASVCPAEAAGLVRSMALAAVEQSAIGLAVAPLGGLRKCRFRDHSGESDGYESLLEGSHDNSLSGGCGSDGGSRNRCVPKCSGGDRGLNRRARPGRHWPKSPRPARSRLP